MTSGQPNGDSDSRYTAIVGLTAEARLRGTAVTPAALPRTAMWTTSMTYEVRVGTTICDSRLRTSRRTIASHSVGTKGTARRQRLDGRWVNTMVFTRPNRRAIGAAAT